MGGGLVYIIVQGGLNNPGSSSVLAENNDTIEEQGTVNEEKPEKPDKPEKVEEEDESGFESDTTAIDSVETFGLNFSDTIFDDTDEIIVLEDRLVGSRQVSVKYLDAPEQGMTEDADSALAEHLDIKPDERVSSYQVEFWRSPINYSGYRLGKNEFILFGIAATETIYFYGMEQTVYLHTTKGLYELNRCDDFEKLRKINDEDFVGSIVNED